MTSTKMVSQLAKLPWKAAKAISSGFIVILASPLLALASEKCPDMPGHSYRESRWEQGIKETTQFSSKIWVIPVENSRNVNITKTLESLIKNDFQLRNKPYSECLLLRRRRNDGDEYLSMVSFSCSNIHGTKTTDQSHKLENMVRGHLTHLDKNGNEFKGRDGVFREHFFCKTGERVMYSMHRAYHDYNILIPQIILFSIARWYASPENFYIRKSPTAPGNFQF